MAPSDVVSAQALQGDPAVRELQMLLVRYGYMTDSQVQTGLGILGPKTREAVGRILAGKQKAAPISAPIPLAGKAADKAKGEGAIDTHFYIVQAGDSPEAIAKRLGVSTSQLEAHPRNAFMKERQKKGGYALQPGDRLAIPDKARPMIRKEEPKQDPSTISVMVDYLLALTQMHPASSLLGLMGIGSEQQPAPKQQNPAPKQATPKASGSTKNASEMLPLKGYSKKHARMFLDVILTEPIESAFLVLLPYLPKVTVMTSGYRSDDDQARLIQKYYGRHKGNPLEKDVEKQRQWLVKKKGLKIARVGSSPHRTGLAFDLSGGSIDDINAAVQKCAREQGSKFPLLNTIIERKQNCLHVNLKPTLTKTS
ncbi:LysM peptidoglycan-binding domain-containing protein [Archangium lipolyticum]|uniref:LysM peptidoglycan-binding domain-containing protein n=1 Tax=Archangium lipolyticum TaxID=2970465 RepID=UPI002149FF4C|nr:LysM peptidoglycan-binding domain-containing protein [Archangium lipolyticum]